MTEQLFPCPSSGFLMFGESPGSYEICELCGWEDDHAQLAHPSMGGGANKLSLAESQKKALEIYPLGVVTVGHHSRLPKWRPLGPSDVISREIPHDGLAYFEAASEDAPVYYWLRDNAL